jgi:hypothetical protein
MLRAARPAPRPSFVRTLEEKLFPGRPQRARRVRPWVAGALATGGLAVTALMLSLLGVGPLAARGERDVKADSDCRYVTVNTRVAEPALVRGADRKPRIVYRNQLVKRQVRRCRRSGPPPR